MMVGGLKEVAEELKRAVQRNRQTCEELVVVESGAYYAQLLFNHGAVYGEVISNTFLAGPEQLAAPQVDRLASLGWSPPGIPCHSACERPHPNFHRTWPDGTPSERIVRDLMVAMMVVAMHAEGEQLTLVETPRRGHPSTGLPSSH